MSNKINKKSLELKNISYVNTNEIHKSNLKQVLKTTGLENSKNSKNKLASTDLNNNYFCNSNNTNNNNHYSHCETSYYFNNNLNNNTQMNKQKTKMCNSVSPNINHTSTLNFQKNNITKSINKPKHISIKQNFSPTISNFSNCISNLHHKKFDINKDIKKINKKNSLNLFSSLLSVNNNTNKNIHMNNITNKNSNEKNNQTQRNKIENLQNSTKNYSNQVELAPSTSLGSTNSNNNLLSSNILVNKKYLNTNPSIKKNIKTKSAEQTNRNPVYYNNESIYNTNYIINFINPNGLKGKNSNNNLKEKNKEAPKANSKEYKDLINITHYNVDNLLSKNKKNGQLKTETISKNKTKIIGNNKTNKKQILNNNGNNNVTNKEILHVNHGSISNRINVNTSNKNSNNNFNEKNANLSNPEELHFYMVNITQNIKEIGENYV